MTEFRRGEVRANGLRFATLEAGDGPLVLCLHGFPDHARSFRHQLPAIAAAGFRAVAPFMRGYAPSEVPADGPYQSAVLGQDAAALIEALGYRQAAVFGHDWGAVAAYGAAILAPERVTRLVTAAVPHGPALGTAFLTSYAQQRRSWYMFFFQTPLADMAVAHDDFAFLAAPLEHGQVARVQRGEGAPSIADRAIKLQALQARGLSGNEVPLLREQIRAQQLKDAKRGRVADLLRLRDQGFDFIKCDRAPEKIVAERRHPSDVRGLPRQSGLQKPRGGAARSG